MATTSQKPVIDDDEEVLDGRGDPKVKQYIVQDSAISVRVTRKRNDIQRFLRGARIYLHSDISNVTDLLRHGAIIEVTPDAKPVRMTALSKAKRAGASDEDIKKEFIPVADARTAEIMGGQQ